MVKSKVMNKQQNIKQLLLKQKKKVNLKDLKISDFEIYSTLGTGTFGRVRLVRVKGDPQVHALKILKKSEVVRLNQVEHIKSEKEILKALDHPFIVSMKTSF